jgi:lipoate-protein ligase A
LPVWNLIETWDASPGFAMGLDEALLRSVGRTPTLRLYSWSPDALSLGYFQRFEDVPAAARHGQVVRRLTGGGAIHHHGRELTFSVTLDADDPAYRGSVPDSYERAHAAVIRALGALGVPSVRMRREEAVASDVEGSGMCFHESTPQDICWAGPAGALAKGVGTAQRRTAGRILHHGSIKLGPSPLEPGVATASDHGVDVDLRAAGAALTAAFAGEFGVELERVVPDPELLEAAAAMGPRHAAPEFVHREPRRRR